VFTTAAQGLSLLILLMPTTSQAQLPPRPPPGSPLLELEPRQTPRLAPGLPRPPPPQPPTTVTGGADHAIERVEIDGVTAIAAADLRRLTTGLVGSAIPEARIEAARQAVIDLYRANGYVYTTANAVISGSVLRFSVIEGYIADVKLEGDVGPAATQVLRFLANLVGRKPLSSADLERWLLLAQDIPGLSVRSTLNPSAGEPGVLTLVAQLSRKPVSGLISADNRAFNLTGPSQGLVAINLDSFTEFGERTQLSYFSAFNNTNRFGQVAEELYLGGSGLKLRLYAGMGQSDPTQQLQAIGYRGETRVFGGQLSYPLVRARAQSLNLVGQFDALESNITNLLGPGGSRQRGSYDSLRVLRAGLDYAVLDTLFGPDRSATNAVSVRISRGLTGLGASTPGDTTTPPPRLGEKIDFHKAAGEFSRTQTLFQPYPDTSLALRTALAWQYATDLLPPAEKFYLGGSRFNRGYYFGQVSGDSAVTLSAELQFNTPTPLPAFIPYDVRSQLYLFYDWGKAFQNTRLEANATLYSWGGGVRLFVSDLAEVDLEGVYRLNRYPNGQGPDISALNAVAFYWQVLFRF
jgi:hemolysin activation/secretion protein